MSSEGFAHKLMIYKGQAEMIMFLLLLPQSSPISHHTTVKFLNFWTPKIFAVIYLKFIQRGETLKFFFCQNDANGIANSEDLDQTALRGAV